jgi:hypothetical protein
LDGLRWNCRRGLANSGEWQQDKNSGSERCRKTHEGNLLKTFSVEYYRAKLDLGKELRGHK